MSETDRTDYDELHKITETLGQEYEELWDEKVLGADEEFVERVDEKEEAKIEEAVFGKVININNRRFNHE